jgi:hypothetical protein
MKSFYSQFFVKTIFSDKHPAALGNFTSQKGWKSSSVLKVPFHKKR